MLARRWPSMNDEQPVGDDGVMILTYVPATT
jgi:hypothetical protein